MSFSDIEDLSMDPRYYPKYLYRVHIPGVSITDWDKKIGFRCGASGNFNMCSRSELSGAIRSHLDWSCTKPSYLISTFDDEDRALDWAWGRIDGGAKTAQLMTIDPDDIVSRRGTPNPIFDVSFVVRRYPDMLPHRVKEAWVQDEVVVLYKIPIGAVRKIEKITA
ncbi:hypothetical protein DRE_06536 [Drechslerella stenobrocha 248]|uniref:DUF7587 domain-containing protein n=1 Tax=Drechslerella stenobrocha 248 TaxID=1043628 RepID=W7HXV7_9PEZI|nr:hypothetical protein DRE_06536 [Drechslerella stenobrocha 248]